MSLPEIVSPERWREARVALLEKEKAMTRARDELSAERRRLPMVEMTKDYRFEGPEGECGLRRSGARRTGRSPRAAPSTPAATRPTSRARRDSGLLPGAAAFRCTVAR